MKRRHRRLPAAFALWLGFLCATPTVGQPPKKTATTPAAAPKDEASKPLGIRQQRVIRLMKQLESKLTDLANKLQETQPDKAKRLKAAFDQSKQLLIEPRMEKIARLLDSDELDTANQEQKKILADLRKLIATLLAANEDDKTAKEIRQLQEWKDRLQKILKEERRQATDSDRIAHKDRTLADLDAQIRELERLIKKQEKVIEQTVKTAEKGIDGLPQVAGKQKAVRKETENLAGKVAGQQSAGSKDGSKEGGKDGSKAGSKDGSPSGGESSQPGAQSLKQASQKQKSAENQLQKGKAKGAESDERKALASMKKALGELKRERKRIAKLPPEEFAKMAKKQDATAEKTGQVKQEVQKAAQSGGSGSSGGGSQGSKNVAKAKQHVQKAQQSMRQASGGLRKKDPNAAAGDQKDAVKELEKALREIEERLKQLREEMQADKLARLEERFTAMLERQRKVNKQTKTLHGKAKANGGKLARAERLAVAKLAAEERELSAEAQKALDVIIEDGTSVVFPRVVEQVRDDLTNVAKMLDDKRVGPYTQSVQKEITLTLIELIEALKRAQKEGGGGGGGGGGGQSKEPPLIPSIAELKLLRSAQMRVNRRTIAFDKERPAGKLDAIMKREIENITAMQEQIAEMARDIAERLAGAPTID